MRYTGALIGILVLAVFIAIGYKLGQLITEINSPSMPSVNVGKVKITEPLQASSNVRWNHFPLKVYLYEDTTDSNYIGDIKTAMGIWQNTRLVSFSLVNNPNDADITVAWVQSLGQKSLDTLGDTKLNFINLTGFGVIQRADIELLTKSGGRKLNSDDMINLGMHEIGHALGLEHVDENDIMNPILVIPSSEIKQVSQRNIERLNELYELPAKPDIRISELSVNKSTLSRFGKNYFYLNISVGVQNVGLKDVENVPVEIYADGNSVKRDDLQPIETGTTLSVVYGNLRVEKDFTNVEVRADQNNLIDELNETNNYAQIIL